jgi:hypothetical protein
MLGYRRIWVFGVHPSGHLRSALDRAESAVLERSLTLIASRRFHGTDVTLWRRR